MKTLSKIDTFWQKFQNTLPSIARGKSYVDVFAFGDTTKMSDEILPLVLAGIKTTTSMLVWDLDAQNRKLWNVGDLSIVLDAKKNPVCVIETIELDIKPFNKVDKKFVYDYGEGERSMKWWENNMWEFYFNQCKRFGKKAERDMPIICERFKIVFKI